MAQKGLFKKKPVINQGPSPEILEAVRRSRVIEERTHAIERRVNLIEKSQIERWREFSGEIRSLNQDISDLKKSIFTLNEKIQLIVSEMQHFSTKEDLQVIKKYLDYWEPLKFITQSQAERLFRDLMEEKK